MTGRFQWDHFGYARRQCKPPNATDVTGECLALGLPVPKVPSSLQSAAGSDEGGNSINGAGLRLDFEVTAGFRVLILRPQSILTVATACTSGDCVSCNVKLTHRCN